MAQSVNTNIISLNAQRNLSTSQTSLATSMQRLSSGLRVNSAKDDAAGLAIAERMSAQVRGMNVAVRNANDAISMTQTAEGALGKIGDNLQRMRELAVQAANATNSDGDRANLQKEFLELQKEIGRTVNSTKFNGKTLFASGSDETLTFQVGAGTTAGQDTIDIKGAILGGGDSAGAVADLTSAYDDATTDAEKVTAEQNIMAAIMKEDWDTDDGIGIGGKNASDTQAAASNATDAINLIDKALDIVNEKRAAFGAAQNRFEAVISNLQVNIENQSAARGRIMDADFATETSNLSRSQILQQAGSAMVAQANQLPQQVLSLLR
ncbi:flagellin FliC [Aquabacterium fontiphilum]|uniref:flagellin N-terminal helical domain-containing protein n=1 Tax=Aquabacterium fontiphilum TaxID=450365 RepID=UPI00137708E7|nr:flagellin [Aquabacterium fontiphilum]NBD19635.1 flagellin FliC [Aquabacterium fontiphilum]